MTNQHKRKLIEVALPLEEINAACKADKDRKTGTLRNVHKWFAPMPLPAWRALLFAALVDDPTSPDERAVMLDAIRGLVKSGADSPDDVDLQRARAIIAAEFPDGPPVVLDPFCGGGSTLVEAQRLGLMSRGYDLNPVPALISRALTQLAAKLHGRQPLHIQSTSGARPTERARSALFGPPPASFAGLDGLAQDISHYAALVHEELASRTRSLFPTKSGEQVVAWIWARTANCPNPACGSETILTTTWWLSKKKGDQAWIEPIISDGKVSVRVLEHQRLGAAPPTPKIGDGVFQCLVCRSSIGPQHLRPEGKAGRLGARLLAVVSEVEGKRTYRAADKDDVAAIRGLEPLDVGLDVPINPSGQGIRVTGYGLNDWADLFLPRQIHAMDALVRAVTHVRHLVLQDGGDEDWAEAIVTFLALAVGKRAQAGCTQTRWKLDSRSGTGKVLPAFARPDLPMTWDFPEAAILDSGAGSWNQCVKTMLDSFPLIPAGEGNVGLSDARDMKVRDSTLVATDPPYFDAIGYADLSDFFYLWHRRILREVHPDLYATITVPKANELTALPGRHGGDRLAARDYFVNGFTRTFEGLKGAASELPIIIVYASKEQGGGTDDRTRWSSILTAMMSADLEITGAWPIHGTGSTRMRGLGSNAVATYVAMVARTRPDNAPTCSVGEFNRALRRELPDAVESLQAASILPVDMAQAVMGPGMAIFSRHSAVLNQSGSPLSVMAALTLINAVYAEVQEEQEGDLDPYSQFAVAWWQKHAWDPGPFGEADALARPKGISVDDVVRAGVVASQPGRVMVVGANAPLDRQWTPQSDVRATAWEGVHHLIDRLVDGGGEMDAAQLLTALDRANLADSTRMLTYRMAMVAAATGRPKDEERYNALIEAWPRLVANAPQSEGLI